MILFILITTILVCIYLYFATGPQSMVNAQPPKPDPLKTMSTYYKYFESAMKTGDYKKADYYGNLIGKIYNYATPANSAENTHMITLTTAVNNTYKANPGFQQYQYDQQRQRR